MLTVHPPTAPPFTPRRRAYLVLEFLLLFVVFPAALALGGPRLPLLPILWLVAAVCLAALLFDPTFDRPALWRIPHFARWWWRLLLLFLLGVALLTPAVAILAPDTLFDFPRHRPLLYVLVMLLYPILSVFPQGIIYRAFLAHRYADLLPKPYLMVIAGAVAFSLMHIVFQNYVAPLLTLVGGAVFMYVYCRSRSLMLAAMIHAAIGCTIFTIGLGHYFLGTPAFVQHLLSP